ncbi:unnamed protein product, partial [Mesorhabditis spiculigera]
MTIAKCHKLPPLPTACLSPVKLTYIPNYPKRDVCSNNVVPSICFFTILVFALTYLLIPSRPNFLYGLSTDRVNQFHEIYDNMNQTEAQMEGRIMAWAADLPAGNNDTFLKWHDERAFVLQENRIFHEQQRKFIENPVAQAIDRQMLQIMDSPTMTIAEKNEELTTLIDEGRITSPFAIVELEQSFLIYFGKILCFYGPTRLTCDHMKFGRS